MESFHEYINEYKKQLAKGDVPKAYRGLMEYIMSLQVAVEQKTKNRRHMNF